MHNFLIRHGALLEECTGEQRERAMALVREGLSAAGFKLAAEGTFLRNPNDPRDKNTPDPPQPKDEFVLKFVKP